MPHLIDLNFLTLLATYGYLAVLLFVGLESMGIPLPGETMLVTAAIYAGTTHQLDIFLVVAAAITGAIMGDNAGFWIGREGGYRLVHRFGKYFRLNDRKLILGEYLFHRHGDKVVFFGRFFAVLRTWAAFLAGTNRMRWWRFLVFNATGGIVWASVYGFGAYALGSGINRISGPAGIALAGVGALAVIAFFIFVRRNQARLEDQAVREMRPEWRRRDLPGEAP